MRSKVVILCVTVFLLLLSLNGSANSQPSDLTGKIDGDTIEIAIEYLTAYPGTETWVEVLMKNPVEVSGYRFLLEIYPSGSLDIARFSQDDTGACFIEGSPFPWISCECLNENCTLVLTEGNGLGDTIIPPSPNYVTLFKIRTDVCCIPDSNTNRSALIHIPLEVSELYDRNGDSLPFTCPWGELFVWWSVPGDASGDSVFNIADVAFLVNYLFMGGPKPCVCEAADCNGDCVIDIGDILGMINCLFIFGGPCVRGCASCPHEDCWP